MKTRILFALMLATVLVKAVEINKEIIGDGTFDAPFVSASQMVASFTSGVEPAGTWYMGNYATWFPAVNTDAKNFWAAVSGTNQIYNHFLAQNTADMLVSGRYEIKLDCKMDEGTTPTPFYLKLSGYNAVVNELSSKLIQGDGVTKTTTHGGYSITFTPTGSTWKTCTATIDITVDVSAKARIYFIFPNVTDVNSLNSIYIDNVSFKRVGDLPLPVEKMYVRPVGDNTSWSHIATNNNVVVKTASDISSLDMAYTYYFAKGAYNLSAGTFNPKVNGQQINVYGGFKGDEITIDLNAREKSDLDENGIVEPWEFTNATIFDGGNTTSANRMIILENSTVLDGITVRNYKMNGFGAPVSAGTVVSLTTVPRTIPVTNTPGFIRNCIIKNISTISASAAGVYICHNGSEVSNSLIEDCNSGSGGSGNNCGGGAYLIGGKLLNSVVRNNRASGTGSGVAGGGIYTNQLADESADIIVRNCLVYNNSAPYSGAIRMNAPANKKSVEVINCTFANNTNTSNSNVEFNGSALFANNIVTGGSRAIRFIGATGSYYVTNSTYNMSMNGTTLINNIPTLDGSPIYPGVSFVQEDDITKYNFKNPTILTGANLPSDANFNQDNYNALRKANFTIVSDNSLAVANAGATSLPTSYNRKGDTANPAIAIVSTIPTKDLRGENRIGNITLGAYQRLATDIPTTPSAINDVSAKNYASISTLGNNITVKVMETATVKVFNLNGVMLKQQLLESTNTINLHAPNGIYIVKVNGKSGQTLQKVIIR